MKGNRAAYQREWRRRNPKSNAASQRKYYLKNKIRMDSYQRQWKRDNKDKEKAYRATSLARSLAANPNFKADQYKRWKAKISAAAKRRRMLNPEKHRAIKRADYKKNRDKRIAYAIKYAAKNPEKVSASLRKWRRENKQHINDYAAKRYRENLLFRIRTKLSNNINRVIKRQKTRKKSSTAKLIGISIPQFKKHIESLFLPGMSWENRSSWHIDHFRPCASFDLEDVEQQKMCFHYTNLAPMWPLDNVKKNSKWNGVLFRPSKGLK